MSDIERYTEGGSMMNENVAVYDPEQVNLSPAELQQAEEFSEKIDLHDSALVLRYGAAAQKKIAEFSDTALQGVRTKDLGETGDLILALMNELQEFSEPEKSGFFGLFKKKEKELERMKERYEETEINVDELTVKLEGCQNILVKDTVILNRMYETNISYIKELTMYIIAGKKRLADARGRELPQLKQKAEASGSAQDAQAANDFAGMCDRFEKKLYDLEITRAVSLQMAPQIRLVQTNSLQMSEKIQAVLNNTIPLWKNQVTMALGMEHSRKAAQTHRSVTDTTNQILRQKSQELREGADVMRKEKDKGFVDIETVKQTSAELMNTLDEVLAVQNEGREKRNAAESELLRIESEMKTKLEDIR